MPQLAPLINGISYSWSQVTVNILGNPVAGITAINYEEKQAIVNNYGAGNLPVSRGFGKIEFTASVTMMMEEVEALMKSVKDGRLQSIPEFDITITYLRASGDVVTHALKNCRFMTNKRDTKVDDTKIEIQLDLVLSHIIWHN
jgi:hypothetical protein